MKDIELEEGRDLTSCETLIMKTIWDEKEDISAIDLRRKLKERYGKDYSRTTLATFLIKMSDKGRSPFGLLVCMADAWHIS